MPGRAKEPTRFRDMARRAGRDRDRSRVAVAVLKADSRVGQGLERALAQAQLTLPQFNVLMELAAAPEGALPLYELNRRLVSTPPNTSFLSSRMEQAGLVTKARDARDSRVVRLGITEGGWAALERGLAAVSAAEKQLLSGFSREELAVLASLLQRVVDPPEPAAQAGSERQRPHHPRG